MIKIDDLSFRYEDEEDENQFAVKNVSLHVKSGEFVCILGQNGSGKSTLSKLINGLFDPTSGTILVDGMDTKDEEKIWDIRRTAGMVFQNPDNQMVASIVEEDVAFGPENLGIPPLEIRQRVDKALRAVDMYEHRLRSPEHLSGGQKQRIAIAGVLAMDPKCIIFDESTAMLDPSGRKEVLSVIKKLNDEGMTVLLITHHMDEAALADRVLVMAGGSVVMRGTPHEIFDKKKELRELGLDIPYSVYASKKLKEKGFDVGLCLHPAELVEGIRGLVRRNNDSGKSEQGRNFSVDGKNGSSREDKQYQSQKKIQGTLDAKENKNNKAKNDGIEKQKTSEEVSKLKRLGNAENTPERRNENPEKEDFYNWEESITEELAPPKSKEVSVELSAVSHVYDYGSPTAFTALDHVDTTIRKGELIGLIGHTGSGKSTLIQHINGLLHPTSGRIIVSNLDITDYKISKKPTRKELLQQKKNLLEIRKRVGLVFQYPEYQLFEETVLKDIMFGPLNLGLSEEEAKKQALDSMDIVGLPHELCEKSPFELSGGQKRRVAIAGVLAMEPEVLILDEPTAGLDPVGRDEILGEIRRLHAEKHCTIIVVSHSMDDMALLAQRIIVMNKGKIAADGAPKDIFVRQDLLERVGLGIPEVTSTLSLLKKDGFDVDDSVLLWKDSVEEILIALTSRERTAVGELWGGKLEDKSNFSSSKEVAAC